MRSTIPSVLAQRRVQGRWRRAMLLDLDHLFHVPLGSAPGWARVRSALALYTQRQKLVDDLSMCTGMQ